MTEITQADPVEALSELKSRLSDADWVTICDYVFAERALCDGFNNAAMIEGARLMQEAAQRPLAKAMTEADIYGRDEVSDDMYGVLSAIRNLDPATVCRTAAMDALIADSADLID